MSRRCPPCNVRPTTAVARQHRPRGRHQRHRSEQQRGRYDARKRDAKHRAEPIHQRSPRGRNGHAREQRHRGCRHARPRRNPPSRQEAPLAQGRGRRAGPSSRAHRASLVGEAALPSHAFHPFVSATRPRSAASRTISGTIQFSASPAKGSTRKGTGTSPPTNKVTTRPATSAHSSASAKAGKRSQVGPAPARAWKPPTRIKHERQEMQSIAQEHHESPDSACDLDQHQASKSQRNRCVNPQHLR